MTRILGTLELDYSDVLILPARSLVESRADVSIERTFTFKHSNRSWTGIPFAAANMDNLASFEMADTLSKYKILTCLTKHYSLNDLVAYFNNADTEYISYSMGISQPDLDKFNAFKTQAKTKFVTIDSANGYMEKFVAFCSEFKERNPDITIIAGNICTGEIAEELAIRGVDIIKAGISGGAQCLTRQKTGVGRPMVSTILDCADKSHHHDSWLMADGGVTCPADACIGLACGADFIMIGSQWAATLETGAEIITKPDGSQYCVFYGMSSSTAQEIHSAEGLKTYRASEGRTSEIPYRGSIHPIIQDYCGGLRSCCSYVGASSVKHLAKKATLVRVSSRLNLSLAQYTIKTI